MRKYPEMIATLVLTACAVMALLWIGFLGNPEANPVVAMGAAFCLLYATTFLLDIQKRQRQETEQLEQSCRGLTVALECVRETDAQLLLAILDREKQRIRQLHERVNELADTLAKSTDQEHRQVIVDALRLAQEEYETARVKLTPMFKELGGVLANVERSLPTLPLRNNNIRAVT